MSELLPCLEHSPAEPVTGTVIWLHGLGADGYDFAPMVPQLALPAIRFVFPHAEAQPVTINAGYVMPSWYDIRSLDHEAKDRENPDDVRASSERIRALVAREVARGVREDRIVLAGFSQGGAMALYTALRHPVPLAGIIVLSGYLVLEDTLEAEATPAGRSSTLLFGHGTHDEVVPVQGGLQAYRRAKELGASCSWRQWPMGHEVCGEEIRAVRTFLYDRLG